MSNFNLDGLTDKASDLVDSQAERIEQGVDKAGDVIDQRTGGRFGDQIDSGIDQGLEQLDRLDGQDDDFGNARATEDLGEASTANPDA